jgi:prolyl-tRNA synthetase
MDLLGLPWRIIVGPRGLKNGVVEVGSRRTSQTEEVSVEEAVKKIIQIYQSI